MKGYSYTSNTVKLFKHMDNLRNLQKGIAKPIMVHVALTNKCNLNCVHCCFSDRDKTLDMDFKVFKEGMINFYNLGVRAFEVTGGGEPTLYPKINESLEFGKELGFKMGLITNGTKLSKVNCWDKLEWVRISLNGFDYGLGNIIHPDLIVGPDKTACYIWNENSEKNIEDVINFANFYKLPTRVAPDCIQPLEDIEKELQHIQDVVGSYPSNYVFVSDFNVKTTRRNDKCFIHAIKPYFFVDGKIYSCPSAELAIENGKDVNEKFYLCDSKDVYNYYKQEFEPKFHSCSYCKYSLQNELLEDILEETDHNDFA